MAQVASAYVRIRPNLTGFRAETQAGVSSAFSGIGKVLGGAFAATSLVTAVKHVANAAAQHQAAFAVLDKTIKDAGASVDGFGASLDSVLAKEGRLKGFSDEELASALTRLVSVTHNTRKAFGELKLAEDVARARHIDVATAALALSRAEQGSTISLSRLGIVIPKVGQSQARLRREHDQLAASGVKFTGQAKLQYEAQLRAAKAADAQATKIEALRVVQQRFGGTAKVFANTAAGSFARFSQDLHQFEVAVGSALLPSLTHAAESVGGFLTRLTQSGQAAQTAKAVMGQLGVVFHDVGVAVQFVAPGFEAVGKALATVSKFVGVGGILALVGGFKAVTTVVGLAQTALTRYAAVAAAGKAAQLAEAAGTNEAAAAQSAYRQVLDLSAQGMSGYGLATKGVAVELGQNTAATEANLATVDASLVKRGEATKAWQAETAAIGKNSEVLAANRGTVRGSLTPVASGSTAALAGTAREQEITARSAADAETRLGIATDASSTVIGAQSRLLARNTAILRADAEAAIGDAAAQGDLSRSFGSSAIAIGSTLESLKATAEASAAVHEGISRAKGLPSADAAAQAAAQEKIAAANEHIAIAHEQLAAVISQSSAVTGTQTRNLAALGGAAEGAAIKLGTLPPAAESVTGALTGVGPAAERAATGTISYGGALELAAGKATAAAGQIDTAAASISGSLKRTALGASEVSASLAPIGAAAETASAGVVAANTQIERSNAAAAASYGEVAVAARLTNAELLAGAVPARNLASGPVSMAAYYRGWSSSAEEAAKATKTVDGALLSSLSTGGQASGVFGRLGGVAERVTPKLKALGQGLLSLAGGWPTIVAAGAAAAAYGIYKLVTAESEATRAANALAAAQQRVADSTRRVSDLTSQLSDQRAALPSLQAAVAQDRLNVATARQAFETTNALPGTRAYQQLLVALQSATGGLTQDTHALGSALKQLGKTRANLAAQQHTSDYLGQKSIDETLALVRQLNAETQKRRPVGTKGAATSTAPAKTEAQAALEAADIFDKAGKKNLAAHADRLASFDIELAAVLRATKKLITPAELKVVLNARGVTEGLRLLALEQEAGTKSAARFQANLRGEQAALAAVAPAVARRILLLREVGQAVHGIPNKHLTNIVFESPNLKVAVAKLVATLEQMKQFSGKGGKAAAEAFAENFLRQLEASGLGKGLANAVKEGLGKLTGLAAATLPELKSYLKDTNASIAKVDTTIATAEQGVHDAGVRVADANRALADAISSGQQKIHDAVVSANQNLYSIGQSLADLLGQFLDAQQKTGSAVDISSAEYKKLRAQIVAGRGGPETVTAAQQLASLTERSQVGASKDISATKDKATRVFNNLADEFEHGRITLKQYVAGVNGELKSLGLTFGSASKLLGPAFADTFRANVDAARRQATLIAETPARLRRGAAQAALAPNVVNPLRAIKEVSQSVDKARERVAKAVESQGKALATLHKDQAKLLPLDQDRNRLLRQIRDKLDAQGVAATKTQQAILALGKGPLTAKAAAAARRETVLAPTRRGEALGIGLTIIPQLGLGLKAKGLLAKHFGGELAIEAISLGLAIPKGITLGLERGRHEAFAKFQAWLVAHHLIAKKTIKSGSPSLLYRDLGLDIGRGLALGIDAARPLVARAAERLLVPLPVALPTRTVSQAIRLRRRVIPQGTPAEALTHAQEGAAAALHARLDLPLRFRAEARVDEAAKQIAAFYARENGRYVYTLVAARTADAARALARFTSDPRHIRVVVRGDTRPIERELAALHARPVRLTVRGEQGRIPVLPGGIEDGGALAAHQTVSELRLSRATAHRDSGHLLTEQRHQTRILAEMLAEKRKKPAHPKPSHAPGAGAAKARQSARHRLVP